IDPFHLHRGGSGVSAFAQARLAAHEIGVLHFNDAPHEPAWNTQRDEDRVLPGEGCLDLRGYIAAARQAGYRGALSLELFSHKLWEQDPFEVAARGLDSMKAIAEN
ncbi:MAG TPA: sugar phosphate isomerase/epimerase, partial [Pirellulales bacterium]